MSASSHPVVVIILSVCQRNPGRLFGGRLERVAERPERWSFTWAFPVDGRVARKEGYSTRVTGSFELAPGYPGCPHCGASSFVLCGNCETLACWDGAEQWLTCPSCHQRNRIEGAITGLRSGGDR